MLVVAFGSDSADPFFSSLFRFAFSSSEEEDDSFLFRNDSKSPVRSSSCNIDFFFEVGFSLRSDCLAPRYVSSLICKIQHYSVLQVWNLKGTLSYSKES